ncbi:MAG: hypothetical protein U1E65_10540 [Myxococcota bacterium]
MLSNAQRLDRLLKNDHINTPGNDAAFCGWSHQCKTLQFRLDAGEVKKFLGRIESTYSKANQRAILEGLFERSKSIGSMGGPGAVAIDSKAAATLLNKFGASIGADVAFKVEKQRPAIPMG